MKDVCIDMERVLELFLEGQAGTIQIVTGHSGVNGAAAVHPILRYKGRLPVHKNTNALVLKGFLNPDSAIEEARAYARLGLVLNEGSVVSISVDEFTASHNLLHLGIASLHCMLHDAKLARRYLVMPLYGQVAASVQFTRESLAVLAVDMTRALQYLHMRQTCHGSVNLDHICSRGGGFVLVNLRRACFMPQTTSLLYSAGYTYQHKVTAQPHPSCSVDAGRGFGLRGRSDLEMLVYSLLTAASRDTASPASGIDYMVPRNPKKKTWKHKSTLFSTPSGIGLPIKDAQKDAHALVADAKDRCAWSSPGLYSAVPWLETFVAEVMQINYAEVPDYDKLCRSSADIVPPYVGPTVATFQSRLPADLLSLADRVTTDVSIPHSVRIPRNVTACIRFLRVLADDGIADPLPALLSWLGSSDIYKLRDLIVNGLSEDPRPRLFRALVLNIIEHSKKSHPCVLELATLYEMPPVELTWPDDDNPVVAEMLPSSVYEVDPIVPPLPEFSWDGTGAILDPDIARMLGIKETDPPFELEPCLFLEIEEGAPLPDIGAWFQ